MKPVPELGGYEARLRCEGFLRVCGVDEAGRGPLAGPVYAGAVILDPQNPIQGLNDSKKLSEKRREALYSAICARSLAYGVGVATEAEIDSLNILQATFLAMRRAVQGLGLTPDLLLIDGNRDPGIPGLPARLLVGGDGLSASVAAASILAKVSRDRYMCAQDALYPGYGFAQHKGYGTAAHNAALLSLGPCELHRRSFLKKLLGEAANRAPTPAQRVGRLGEEYAALRLCCEGCRLLARNFRAAGGEVDLVAECGEALIFVEVKTRAQNPLVSPGEAVTAAQWERLRAAAACFPGFEDQRRVPRFDLIEILYDERAQGPFSVTDYRHHPGYYPAE